MRDSTVQRTALPLDPVKVPALITKSGATNVGGVVMVVLARFKAPPLAPIST